MAKASHKTQPKTGEPPNERRGMGAVPPFKTGDSMNKELLAKLGQLGSTVVVVMIMIVLACLVTPKIAKWIEKKNPELAEKVERKGLAPERVEEDAKGRIPEDDSGEGYETHSTFESSEEEDFDPNYKIYHEDIYGFNFKKKKNNDGTSDKK